MVKESLLKVAHHTPLLMSSAVVAKYINPDTDFADQFDD